MFRRCVKSENNRENEQKNGIRKQATEKVTLQNEKTMIYFIWRGALQ